MAYWQTVQVARPDCVVCYSRAGEHFHPNLGVVCHRCMLALQYANPAYLKDREAEAAHEDVLLMLLNTENLYAISRAADYLALVSATVARNPLARMKKVT